MLRRVLVVDDHDGVRAAIVNVLTADGFDVVGEASDYERALQVARRVRPDLVLLDIRLPGPDGFAVARALCHLRPAPVVVLMSSRDAAVYGQELDRSPAAAFITKSELSAAGLKRAIGDDVS